MLRDASVMLAVLRISSGVELRPVLRPVVRRPLDVIVAPVRAGLCRTDLHVAFGRIRCAEPRILGHEVSGVVTAVGAEVTRVRPGDRVTVEPVMACERCEACLRALPCLNPHMLGIDLDGGFAQSLSVPERSVHSVPESLSFEKAAFVEPVAATLAVLNCPIGQNEAGTVIGTGRLAELTRRVLWARGFRDVRLCADDGVGFEGERDWVVDTVGTSHSLDTAMRLVRQGGRVLLKSRPAERVAMDVARAVQRELTFHAVRYAPFREAIELLCSTAFEVEDLLGACYPLSQYASVFQQAELSEQSKVFFAPNPELG